MDAKSIAQLIYEEAGPMGRCQISRDLWNQLRAGLPEPEIKLHPLFTGCELYVSESVPANEVWVVSVMGGELRVTRIINLKRRLGQSGTQEVSVGSKTATAVRHDWQKGSHTSGGQTVNDVFVCSLCDAWTSYLGAPQFYEYDVCPKRDRRKGKADRRNGSHGGHQ